MKPFLPALLVLLQATTVSADRHVSFDTPGYDRTWRPVALTDAERELLSTRSDPPRTAFDYFLLLSGNYFRNIASETDRRVTFIDRETLSDRYLHAEYTIPSVDAGAFRITIRLFGDEDDPLIAIRHRGGTKKLYAAKQNGPQGLWRVAVHRPEFWRYRGGAYSQGGGFFRVSDSVLPELSIDSILDHYGSYYKVHHGEVETIHLAYALPREGPKIKVTRDSVIDPGKRHVWREYTYRGGKFEPAISSEEAGDREPAPAPETKPAGKEKPKAEPEARPK